MHVCIYIYVLMYNIMYLLKYIYIYIYQQILLDIYIYVCMYICTVYIYIYIYNIIQPSFNHIYIFTHIIHVQLIYNSYTTHIYNLFLVRITGMEFQLQFFRVQICPVPFLKMGNSTMNPCFWGPNCEVYILKLTITYSNS